MSFFGKLFGRHPTKNLDKATLLAAKIELARALTKARIRSDPMARLAGVSPDSVDALSDYAAFGTPEAAIITIVESYTDMKRQGIPDAQIFALVEGHRSMIGAGAMPSPLTLRSYIRYRISIEHSTNAPVSDNSMDYSITEARKFFDSV